MTLIPDSVRNMDAVAERTESGRAYQAAQATHYAAQDLPTALQLYLKVVALYPDSEEARHARQQAQKIINARAGDQKRRETQTGLAVDLPAKDDPTGEDRSMWQP